MLCKHCKTATRGSLQSLNFVPCQKETQDRGTKKNPRHLGEKLDAQPLQLPFSVFFFPWLCKQCFAFQWLERQYSPTYLITIYRILRSIYIQIRPAADEKNVSSSITAFNNPQRNENPRKSWYHFIPMKINSLSITENSKKNSQVLFSLTFIIRP